jgi:hypothetical protein
MERSHRNLLAFAILGAFLLAVGWRLVRVREPAPVYTPRSSIRSERA